VESFWNYKEHGMTRRTAGRTLAAGLATSLLASAAEEKLTPPDGYTIADMGGLKHYMPPKPEEISMLIYPGMTALDLIGPQQVFGYMMGANVRLVWKSTDPVVADTGVLITPDVAIKDVTGNVDLIFAPGGGAGTIALMNDPTILDFLAEKGKTARWVTSVCSGSLILGAAGLLRGYKATSHWAVREVLPSLGAEVTPGRVVQDRNRITAGGITSGIDFGLHIAGILRGADFGRALELMLEYDPHPPYHSGTPELAPAGIRDGIRGMYAPSVKSALANAAAAKARWAKA
jgi:cyclohexyl-isocyanide hydratase